MAMTSTGLDGQGDVEVMEIDRHLWQRIMIGLNGDAPTAQSCGQELMARGMTLGWIADLAERKYM